MCSRPSIAFSSTRGAARSLTPTRWCKSLVIHHLEIIGEACRALSDELRSRHSEVPWPAIIGMRNILVHDYFGLNLDEVWTAAERDLPDLKRRIQAILAIERGTAD